LAHDKGSDYRLSDSAAFHAVWDRRRFPKNLDDRVHESDRKFVRNELIVLERALLQLLESTRGIRWNDYPAKQRLAENKLAQLEMALSHDLAIPNTLVCTDPEKVKEFRKHNERIVVKPFISHLWVENDLPRYEAATALLAPGDDLEDASISVCPAIYQEAVDKAADIRAVLIGDEVFATRYPVSGSGNDHVDVRVNIRRGDVGEVTKIELPGTVMSAFKAMASDFGITYASADFLEDRQGRLFFIDLNPVGQFLFNEAYVEDLPLLDAFVRHLLDVPAAHRNRVVRWKEYLETEDYANFVLELADASGNAIQPEPFWTAVNSPSQTEEAKA
jgi:glutathione synthase/RimK-type ligase-like ATP-grasp enzyme